MAEKSDIQLYALSTCIHCKKCKEFLEENEIAFECVFVDMLAGEERSETISILKKHNPKLSFPTLVVKNGGAVIVGFHKDQIEEALDL